MRPLQRIRVRSTTPALFSGYCFSLLSDRPKMAGRETDQRKTRTPSTKHLSQIRPQYKKLKLSR